MAYIDIHHQQLVYRYEGQGQWLYTTKPPNQQPATQDSTFYPLPNNLVPLRVLQLLVNNLPPPNGKTTVRIYG